MAFCSRFVFKGNVLAKRKPLFCFGQKCSGKRTIVIILAKTCRLALC